MMTNENNSSRLETAIALLIALVTVIGALAAWRSSVAADGSGDEDFAGLRATLNAEETRALNYVDAYEHYGAYTAYRRYEALGDAIAEDMADASEEEYEKLEAERADAYDLSIANESLFPNRFLSRDGTYNVEREIGEQWATEAR